MSEKIRFPVIKASPSILCVESDFLAILDWIEKYLESPEKTFSAIMNLI